MSKAIEDISAVRIIDRALDIIFRAFEDFIVRALEDLIVRVLDDLIVRISTAPLLRAI